MNQLKSWKSFVMFSFCLHAPWGFLCCLHVGLGVGQVRGRACWVWGVNGLRRADGVGWRAGRAKSCGGGVSWTGRRCCCCGGGGGGGDGDGSGGTSCRVHRASGGGGRICWRRSRVSGAHGAGWVDGSRTGRAREVHRGWGGGAGWIGRIGWAG